MWASWFSNTTKIDLFVYILYNTTRILYTMQASRARHFFAILGYEAKVGNRYIRIHYKVILHHETEENLLVLVQIP